MTISSIGCPNQIAHPGFHIVGDARMALEAPRGEKRRFRVVLE
jgi:hypothetical protein